ncbi:MAG: hypothetical protein ACLTJG_03325 [[Clostridium] innocuum]
MEKGGHPYYEHIRREGVKISVCSAVQPAADYRYVVAVVVVAMTSFAMSLRH